MRDKSDRTTLISTRVDERTKAMLQEEAQLGHRTISDQLRLIIDFWLSESVRGRDFQ